MNVRLSYADINNNGSIEPASEILEENNYYPFGLKHQGYNELANANRSEQAEKYQYNGKEWNDAFGLNIYEYGARGYDPAIGRFFNMDNYAESFLDMSPYQYAGNNPVFFIDKNGDHIYIFDQGQTYKFSDGKLYARGDKDAWVEHTPEAGSFLETIFNALQEVYALSDISGEGGGAGGFGRELLNYFNNENVNTHIINYDALPGYLKRYKDQQGGIESTSNFTYPGNGYNYTVIDMNTRHTYFGANLTEHQSSLSQVIVHELGHALLNVNNMSYTYWFGNSGPRKSEVFASYVENRYAMGRNSALRGYYMGPESGQMFQSILVPNILNPFGNPYLHTNMQILNEFKKGFQTIPNTHFLFN